MKNKIIISKDFAESLKIYAISKKSLAKKVYDIKNYLEINGLDLAFFKQFDVKNLGNNYFRIKFVPYRIIIYLRDKNTIEFIEFFKRKGKSDYKDYK